MKNNCIYFVEGRCEEKLLNALKEQPPKIHPGRVKVFNVIQNNLSNSQLITIQPGTTVALVFDTDIPLTDCLKENIRRLGKYCSKIKVVFLPQVLNFEDELVRCSDLRSTSDLTHSKSNKDFKRDFCAMTNARVALERVNLNVEKLWTEDAPADFAFFEKNSDFVKQ
ncbi:MAG: hypothetical protein PHY23_08405 [Oscillospiraceae bacterium]|nr:hypothetical protein [Oscillospiraceae bacterium]